MARLGGITLWALEEIIMAKEPKTICDDCTHNTVCGEESHLDPACTYCAEKEISTAAKQIIVEFTETELFLIEMAVDEVLWKLEPNGPNYIKYDLLNQKVRGHRLAMSKKDNLV